MNKKNITEVQSKLLEMNEVIEKLDPAIRSAAFEIMVPYYFDSQPSQKHKHEDSSTGQKDRSGREKADTSDLSSFIGSFEHGKPKDNVMLLAAWMYSQYGAHPIQAKEIKELSDACGLVIPARPDNTMRTAKDKGKSLFTQQGKAWKPTVSGEIYLKETYAVTKGNKTIPKD
ncbi:hypothetical protein [Marinimicrobium sp. LS-A18]|uniref:hypothetical protein n=1 Tax=Marinimicrobium sp. LS-A18 TaxID=1381596 RepID=UPI00126928E9|nr:hypothetical protein [Marinimicrobium sp. LS-A18]